MNIKKITFLPLSKNCENLTLAPIIHLKNKNINKSDWLKENKREIINFYKSTLNLLENNNIIIKNEQLFKDNFLLFMYNNSNLL